ncbi:MAG: hypothetical protein LBE27_03765 [Deltaproteobacteria bacterium]|jgi:hypothetical protein|nr:hypothetical protein [Deltaproteobacteria bacterium]
MHPFIFSLSTDSRPFKILKESISVQLKMIVRDYILDVRSTYSHVHLKNLIQLMILAQANASLLMNLLTTFKDSKVSPIIYFIMLTRVTEYILSSIKQIREHLAGISQDPKYLGLCSITQNELNSVSCDFVRPTKALDLKRTVATGSLPGG